MKILLKTMDSATPSPERIELSAMRKNDNGAVKHYMVPSSEVEALIAELKVEEEAEAKKADASSADM